MVVSGFQTVPYVIAAICELLHTRIRAQTLPLPTSGDLFICAKHLFVAAKEETPATRGYVLAGVRSLCVVGTSHIVGRSDQVVALIPVLRFVRSRQRFVRRGQEWKKAPAIDGRGQQHRHQK